MQKKPKIFHIVEIIGEDVFTYTVDLSKILVKNDLGTGIYIAKKVVV